MPPKLVCVHMVCTQVWWDVVGSNIEPPRVFDFTHMGFRHLRGFWTYRGNSLVGSTGGNLERVCAHPCYYMFL